MSEKKLILGAIAGDIIGSSHEFRPIKTTDFKLFDERSRFTDDTVMTIANMKWLIESKERNKDDLIDCMHELGNEYKHVGYGGHFKIWLSNKDRESYCSYGNGSGMRSSAVGWAFDTLEEVLEYSELSSIVTHNHPQGIKGAQSIASSVFLARKGKTKKEIKEYVEETFGYDLNRTVDEIRPSYKFDVTCQGSVPEAILCFLESEDYESAVRLAVSIGGDADTQACMAGAIAEAYYGEMPKSIEIETIKILTPDLMKIVKDFSENIAIGNEK